MKKICFIFLTGIIVFSSCSINKSDSIEQTESAVEAHTTVIQSQRETTVIDDQEINETISNESLSVENMPEIICVMSYNRYNSNIFGFYITKSGQMKMYDFRRIAPDEKYTIPEVYEQLGDASCDSIIICENKTFDTPTGTVDGIITEDELNSISERRLFEYYKRLKEAPGAFLWNGVAEVDDSADWNYYGIRYNNNELDFVRLGGYGISYVSDYSKSDMITKDLFIEVSSWFPFIPNSYEY